MIPKRSAKPSDDRRYFKEVRFRQIRALFEIAKHGTFAAASRSLGMATPSVWRQVRALEDDYGVQLVSAKGHDVRLTEDGERLLDLAAPLVEGFDSLKKVFQDQHGKAERHLRVAAPATMLNSPMRHVIAHYRETYPQVRLSLIDAPSRIAWQLLEAEKADLAVVGTPQGVTLPTRFEATPLVRYPFEVVCLESHPFANITNPKLRDIVKQPLILAGEDSSSRMHFDYLVAKAGLSDLVNVIVTAGNVTSILNYVALGMGIAVLTRPATQTLQVPSDLNARFIHRDVSHFLGYDHIALLHPKGRHELSHVRAFRERVIQGLRTE
ncbi:MAG: LysR family transcriptional regulator [Prosthecobacter sp.]